MNTGIKLAVERLRIFLFIADRLSVGSFIVKVIVTRIATLNARQLRKSHRREFLRLPRISDRAAVARLECAGSSALREGFRLEEQVQR